MTTPLNDFAGAFLKAQAAMEDPAKDSKNPHFKSRFVSLKGVLDAVRPPLHKAGITVLQSLDVHEGQPVVVTTLLHTSGQSMTSRCPVICAKQNDPQALGSAITYARRYAVAAICGVAPSDDDDDGEAAVSRPRQQSADRREAPTTEPFELVEEAISAINGCKSGLALDVIRHRISASKFAGTDLEMVKEAGIRKREALQQ